MPDTIPRSPGEQAAYGYRQLPGLGTSGRPDPNSMIYAGIGIALGILMGTFLAESFQHGRLPLIAPVSVQTSARASGPSKTPAAETLKAPPAQVYAQSQNSPPSTLKESSVTRPAATHIVSAIRKHRTVHKLAVRGRHWFRRRYHSKRRLRAVPTLPASARLPEATTAASPMPAIDPFIFTVEGDDTEANYIDSTGMIETYEGETFSVERRLNERESALLRDFPENVHYHCDQSGDCTLILAHQVALVAKRINSLH